MAQANGLLDWIQTPAGIGLLSAVAGGMAGAQRGTPWNNAGRAGIAGLAGYTGAKDQINKESDNALTRKYKKLQMDEITQQLANRKGMRESLQGLYKPAGTAEYQADNPFGEDLGSLQTETQATFGGRPVDPVMAAVLPYAQPDDILKMAGGQNKTAEQKNWEYAQNLPEDQRSAFTASSGSTSPANVQEWQFFSKLDPQAQAQFLEMKRNPQIMNLGGYQAVRAPGGGVGESYAVTPKPTDMPAFQAAQETAKGEAKIAVEREADRPKMESKIGAEDAKLKRLTDVINKAKTQANMFSAGPIGQVTSGIGGTPAKNLDATLNTVKANLGFDELQQMRDNSPTGGALGQVAVQEINYLQSVVANLDPNQSPQQLRDNLDIVLKAKQESNERIKAAYEKTYQTGNNQIPADIQFANKRRAEGASDEQIVRELNEMVRKSEKPAQPKNVKSTGTFENPIRVTNDADYNNVPKGKYYKAPDGTTRIRK